MRTPENVDPHRFTVPISPQNRFDIKPAPSVSSAAPQFSHVPLPPSAVAQGTQSPPTKLLLLIALTFKQGRISNDEKGKLKDLTLGGHLLLVAALDVFEIDQDLDEWVDTVKRICKLC